MSDITPYLRPPEPRHFFWMGVGITKLNGGCVVVGVPNKNFRSLEEAQQHIGGQRPEAARAAARRETKNTPGVTWTPLEDGQGHSL